ncbi:MAG: leucine--tRNA ligase [Ruminococcus bromii]|uniref:leucine--tRNA ligase n=1 Tax=Ruminococcus sp. YE282 TaxID=3158780 RepID=UPI000880DA92|nr:leucine--tRNA ligase [Ruminococcus bromii]MDD6433896.1 leucine--tRNA ligase [Ruminococcus bromii]MDY4710835.1 leucine--tRNA ligase [Ruminococcus bromii]MEE0962805.1 leucine--tRNA ligase [Ruminococcus bromii]MEE3498815.1 leucine--tRNA ligase [Ruminococcus bromii]
MKYNHKAVEQKWQKIWEDKGVFHADPHSDKEKFYALIEFPYPSGQGLHVGHPRPYTALDTVARKRRLQGYNVLYPIGWDAFGLPTENYAIKNHIHPEIVTKKNIARFKKQIQSLGISFDWSREINTTDPDYYKWTQWIFIQLFKHGLAYKKEMNVNWCTSCKCVLANEEVVNGVCERCGSEVVHKVKSQWMLKITEYADRLINDLDLVDYPDRVKAQQKNWIGRSTGAEVDFKTTTGDTLTVYTTRPDTLYGATYMVISPEHPLIEKWSGIISNIDAVREYQAAAARKSDFERTEVAKEKTGVKLDGVKAVNPVNNKEIPIFISDYVLVSYGTGAIMAVPAHDTRDWEFAKKFDLPIIEVVKGGNVQEEAFTDCATGVMVNSGILDGLSVEDAKKKIIEWLTENGKGHTKVNYKLRDWVFSRQRYWGEPIPIVHCDKCGYVPIDESELPLRLPMVESYEPTDNGESPLAKMTDWIETTCPHCGGKAYRETDTMPQWAGSSWYYLRYMDPHNDKALASKEALEYWSPVDWYNGGMEHTTLHLLYSRFWHKFLYDIGVVPTKEPYAKRTSHGMILGENGEKMSKSRGNVVNPDDIVDEYGADTMRLYEMFIGDFEKAAPWSQASIRGCRRFVERYWNLQTILIDGDKIRPELESAFHKAIKKVGEDIENIKFNTAIATLMALINDITNVKSINKEELRIFSILLNPFAPHVTEEVYEACKLGNGILAEAEWPKYDESKCVDDTVEIVVQVNGKIKAKLNVSVDATKEEILELAKADEKVANAVNGMNIIKEIVVPKKLVNIVVKP